MAEASFNLAALFEQAFGYKTRAFDPKFAPITGNNALRTEHGTNGSAYYAMHNGVEYFMPVTLSYTESDSVTESVQLQFPIIELSSKKTIVETQLTERRGTVKELINIQDYEIKIKGFIIGTQHEFPEQDVISLRNLYERNEALSIQCPLTDIFLLRSGRTGSDKVVIKDLKFPFITGVKNVKAYEMTLISDEPFNLIKIS